MAAKLKVDELESVDGSTNLILNNSITMASGKTIPAPSLTGNLPAISGAALTSLPSQTDQNFTNADHSKLDAIEASADVTDATNVGTVVNGKQTIWVPSNAMTPTTSNGCADITAVETTAGRPDMYVLDFSHTADEHAQFTVAFPKSWNLGTVSFQFFWSGGATGNNGCTFALQGVAVGNDNTIDVAYGTAIAVDDRDTTVALEDLFVSPESGAVTIAGSPADDELCYFRIFRDVSDSNDDMNGDARLHGIKIFYTTDALNDA